MPPQISVIIPTYNTARFVAEAVASALGQTLPPLEVIVVDDGSTDDTEAVLRPFGEQIRRIRQSNSGVSAARNRGIQEARGELITFLDADDIWLPDKLEKQWDCLREHPTAGLVHTSILRWNEETGETSPGLGRLEEKAGECYAAMFIRGGVIPSATMIKRECLDRVGGFDKSIREASTQDYDLFLRIARHYEFAFVDEPLTLYRQHAANASSHELTMRVDELRVVWKALAADPELTRLVGRRKVAKRLHDLLFSIGYIHHDAYRRNEARRFLLRALAHQPWRFHTLALFLANLLPSPWVRGLRRFKARLS